MGELVGDENIEPAHASVPMALHGQCEVELMAWKTVAAKAAFLYAKAMHPAMSDEDAEVMATSALGVWVSNERREAAGTRNYRQEARG